jgi:hypothetical protein
VCQKKTWRGAIFCFVKCVLMSSPRVQVIDLYLFEQKGFYNTIGTAAAAHESIECLQVLLDFKADV